MNDRLREIMARVAAADGRLDGLLLDLRAMAGEMLAGRKDLSAAKNELIELARELAEPPPPPPPVDPPVEPPPPAGSLEAYIASLPFAAELPALPTYRKPLRVDCDWIMRPGGSTRPGDAYRQWLQMGHTTDEVFTIGVEGVVENIRVGHGWGSIGGDTIGTQARDDRVRIRLVGLTEDAECKLTIGQQWARVDRLEVHDLGLRGQSSNFIVSTINNGHPLGDLVFDGCWFLQGADRPNHHVSGAHLNDHRSLTIRNHKNKAGISFREHCFYLKSSTEGPTWILDSDLGGGNRTWFQRRPDVVGNARPGGPFMVFRNHGDSYGWNHGSDGSSYNGGSAITIWTAPDDSVYVAGNHVRDAKYGCLMIGGQGPGKDHTLPGQHPVQRAWVWDNDFENLRGDRSCAAISCTGEVHIGPNRFESGRTLLMLDSEWQMSRVGIPNGSVALHDVDLVHVDIRTAFGGVTRSLTTAEKSAMLQAL